MTRLDTQIPANGIAQAAKDMASARELLVFALDMGRHAALADAAWRDWRWPVAGVLLTAVLLLACLPLRGGATPMAMVFAPKAGAAAIQGHRRMLGLAWIAYLAVTYLYLLIEQRSPVPAMPATILAVSLFFGAIIGGWLHVALLAALLRLSLSLLGCRAVPYGRLLAALVAASFPLVPFMLGALVALQGHVGRLHDAFQAASAHLPGIVVAAGLIVIGYVWSMMTSISAIAGAAGTTRKRALAAVLLLLAAVLVLVGVVAGIVRLVH